MGFPILWLADYEALRDKSPAMVNTLHIYDQKSDQYTSITHPASVHLVATAAKAVCQQCDVILPSISTAMCTIVFHISRGEYLHGTGGKRGIKREY